MAEQNAVITTHGLSKQYDSVWRVKDVDLTIREGEVYGFLGPNGAGKSTTMKMLLGLVHPTEGSVNVLGLPFNEENRIKILQNVGSLIEAPSYYGHLTGRENMEVVRRLLDLPQKNIDNAVHIVRMENQMDKKVKHYSLGMKQRLGIAMALARFPKLLILDEPTNGLDPAGMEEIRDLIKTLPKQYGMTVMVSSHLLSEIDQMATAVGIINHGQLIFQDKMDVLKSKRRPRLALRTNSNAVAGQILRTLSPQFDDKFTDKLLLPYMEDARIAQAVQLLLQNHIEIYRIEEQQSSLEDIFLEMTGEGTSL